jgi:UDP-N-acetylmuramyl pentapeptide phosphotransferase/UDP-N-acetylglucosamine-1-phosphate transferase
LNTSLQGHRPLADAGALLLPTLAVVLFHLLNLRLQTPTAGGLAFLAAALVAFYFFPRRRIRVGRVLAATLLAAGAVVLLGLLL